MTINKKTLLFGLITFISVLFFNCAFQFAPHILSYLESPTISRKNTNNINVINRSIYEEEVVFPPEIENPLKEYSEVTTPFWVVVILFVLLLIIFKPFFVCKGLMYSFLIGLGGLFLAIAVNNIIQFFIILLPIFSSYILAVYLKREDPIIGRITTVFILTSAQVVLITEILSLFRLVEPKLYFLIFILIALILLPITRFRMIFIKEDILLLQKSINQFFSIIREDKLLAVFSSCLFFSILWRCVQIVFWPLNNSDSMQYHLARIAYWLQNQSVGYFDTVNLKQVDFPVNGDILILWTMIASKQEMLCGFVQMVSYFMIALLIYQCVRVYLKTNQKIALTISLIWCALPSVVLVSTTTQIELIVTCFVLYALVRFLTGNRHDFINIILIGISIGLAIGAKTTGIMFAIPFFLIIAITLYKEKTKKVIYEKYGISIALGTFFLGAYTYIQNLIFYDHIFGSKYLRSMHLSSFSIKGFFSTSSQYLYDLLTNQTGLHMYINTLSNTYNEACAFIGENAFAFLRIDNSAADVFNRKFHFDSWIHKFKIHEDYAYFGFVGGVVVVLIVYSLMKFIWNCIRKDKKCNRYFLLAFISSSYFAIYSFTGKWHFWAGRHFIIMITIAITLLVIVFRKDSNQLNWVAKTLVIYSIIMLFPNTLMNELKPLNPYFADREGFNVHAEYPINDFRGIKKLVYNHDKIGLRNLHRPYEEMLLRNFNKAVSEDSVIGLCVGTAYQEYPYFGDKLKRKMYHLKRNGINMDKYDYLIVRSSLLSRKKFMHINNFIDRYYEPYKYLGKTRFNKDIWLYVRKNRNNYSIEG